MHDYLAGKKKADHNIYDLNFFAYKLAIVLCISLWAASFLDVQIRHAPMFTQILIWIAAPIIVSLVLFMSDRDKKYNLVPYCRKENFEFLGLYNLKESDLDNRHDVLARDEEIEYVRNVLEEIIFPQSSVKQALCITGPSGCGKSSILNFFKHAYKDEYEIFDFAGNYREFTGYMVSLFGTNIDRRISEMTSVGKVVFILDQFERFFFLSAKDQEHIRDVIRYLCVKNTSIIVSLREEYLADFLKRFDMNNLLSEDKVQDSVPSGLLKKMFGVVDTEDDIRTRSVLFSLRHPAETDVWEDHRIKNNASVHLDTNDPVIMEKMGATLLYCRNQNEMSFRMNGENSNASVLESKCRKLFGEKDGSLLFRKHVHEPLIEQQIVFHMAEFNQKILLRPEEELHAFAGKDMNELLNQYFDHQLASCSNYFHASRLLYLLSQARMHQLSLKTRDLENYLLPNLFAEKGHEQLSNVIEQLEKMQLIRKNTEGSGLEYEIAHDFIASTYLNYCSTNMDRNVKNALDLFISEYADDKRKASFTEKISLRKDIRNQHFYRNISYFALAFMVVTDLVQRFAFNPWTSIWSDRNPYGDYVPLFPTLITLLSGVYLYQMYDKTVKYYRGEKVRTLKIIYALCAVLAWMAVFAYPHFLFFDGMGLAIASLAIALLLDQNYRQTCRNELMAYGVKSVMIGTVFAFAHIMFFLSDSQFEDFLILSEFIMFTILVAYGFYFHMTQEFLFARMSDSASERV